MNKVFKTFIKKRAIPLYKMGISKYGNRDTDLLIIDSLILVYVL